MTYREMLKRDKPELTKRRGRDSRIGCPGDHYAGAARIHSDDCIEAPGCDACWDREVPEE